MIKIVVPFSGGKDSQACLKLALQNYPAEEVRGLFLDTKFEHPLTYQHVDNIEKLYGVKIDKVSAGNVPDLVLKYNRFPDNRVRFCTSTLKIDPSKICYKYLARKQGAGFEVWLGMRRSESTNRSIRYKGIIGEEIYAPHEVLKSYPQYLNKKLGVWMRLPIVEWTDEDVFEFLEGEENPLYSQGSKRVGCFPCLASGDRSKERAFTQDDFGRSQRVLVHELEKKIGESIFTSKGGIERNEGNGCSFCSI